MNLSATKDKKQQRIVEQCGTCRYYLEDDEFEPDPDEPDAPTGVCRRFPPRILPGITGAVALFPDVSKTNDWCGEFVPATAE